MNKLFLFLALCSIAVACKDIDSPYNIVEHWGNNDDIRIISLRADTIRIDASRTSLSGTWYLKDSVLCFIDEYTVGVKEFDLNGNYFDEYIRQGRGPDELVSAAFSAAFEDSTGRFIIQDSNCWVHVFDTNYHTAYTPDKAWFLMLNKNFEEQNWEKLMRHPDPEIAEMYEYNYICNRMLAYEGNVVLPIITEHIRYNGYEIRSSARDFWRNSYIVISFNPEKLPGSYRLIGHYPPVYHKRNIPIFGDYDICRSNTDGFAVTFAAAPYIYVFNSDGNIDGKFGLAEDGIRGRYPETTTFDEYESEYQAQRREYGYYHRLAHCGGYYFRTCVLDENAGCVLQIYDETYNLVGRIPYRGLLEIIGECDNTFYASCGTDLNTEEFLLIKFTLE